MHRDKGSYVNNRHLMCRAFANSIDLLFKLRFIYFYFTLIFNFINIEGYAYDQDEHPITNEAYVSVEWELDMTPQPVLPKHNKGKIIVFFVLSRNYWPTNPFVLFSHLSVRHRFRN